jgi:hypothetical protein
VGAFDNEWARATLKGLKGVEVVVEELSPDEIADGLTREQLQTDVELRLRKVGISVVSKEESKNIPNVPTLYMSAHLLKNSTGLYAYCINVELQQLMKLIRDPKVVAYPATWSTGEVLGTVGSLNMVQAVREGVGDQIDRFINAYLAVNPITPQR